MENRITELRGKLPQPDALSIYRQINSLRSACFTLRRLHLPCIVFSIRRLSIQETHSDNKKVYCARISGRGTVEFTTADNLSPKEPKRLIFAHPWIRYIRGPNDGVTWEGDSGSDSDSDSGSDADPGSGCNAVLNSGCNAAPNLDPNSNAGLDNVVQPSPLDAVPTPQVNDYTRALQMVARLGQPFSALLLVQQPNGEYKRVAAEHEIVVPGLGTEVDSKSIQVKVLEIL